MLNGISPVIGPDLLSVMYRMGHGDELVLADMHYPSESAGPPVIRADGHSIPALLKGILPLLPLDRYVKSPVIMMAPVQGDELDPTVEDEYCRLLARHDDREFTIERLERFAFYERASKAFAIVASGDAANYTNVILKKGHVSL